MESENKFENRGKVTNLESSEPKEERLVPKVYELIAAGADSNALVQQIYTDFYDKSKDPEKLYLGFSAIIEKGAEGKAVLGYLAQGPDELGALAKKVLETSSPEDLERVLGMNRMPHKFERLENDLREIRELYDYAVKKGYTTVSFQECVSSLHKAASKGSLPGQFTGAIESSPVCVEDTFGNHEPGYLELMGPLEILRLRTMEQPRMLLLGSLGKYSAREFSILAKKINENTETYVIDKHSLPAQLVHGDRKNSGNVVVQADARALPFDGGAMDYVFTDKLFHYLNVDGTSPDFRKSIGEIFLEVARILKKGGSFFIVEDTYGRFKPSNDILGAKNEIQSLALQAGLKPIVFGTDSFSFRFRPEVSSATIDDNGFPHYGDARVTHSSGRGIYGRFTKDF